MDGKRYENMRLIPFTMYFYRCGNDLVKLYRSPEVRQYVCGEIDPVVTVEFKKVIISFKVHYHEKHF